MHQTRGNSGKRSAADPSKKAFESVASTIAEVGREFHVRGWVLGTSGNFSAVLRREPLCLAITSTGSDKGHLSLDQILEVDETLSVSRGKGRPSAETALHLAIVRGRQAGAVLHTHSVWSTVLSGWHASKGGVAIEGYEMLKGLEGIRTHEHREWLPIVENSQDMRELARQVSKTLQDNPGAHGFLLRGHGLYTWGADLPEAKRHIEIFEFLMETLVRTAGKAC
jgi:methylthioribulose-1-phosphate dehydratase